MAFSWARLEEKSAVVILLLTCFEPLSIYDWLLPLLLNVLLGWKSVILRKEDNYTDTILGMNIVATTFFQKTPDIFTTYDKWKEFREIYGQYNFSALLFISI